MNKLEDIKSKYQTYPTIMKIDDYQYEFRAITSKSQLLLCLGLWVLLWFTFFILGIWLIPESQINILYNIEIFFLPLILSILSLSLISNYLVSSQVSIITESNYLIIKVKKKCTYISIDEISSIEFDDIKKTLFRSKIIYFYKKNNSKKYIITAFVLTFPKHMKTLQFFVDYKLKKYLESNHFEISTINNDLIKKLFFQNNY